MEISGSVWEIVSALAATGGLTFAGYELHKNNQTLKANNEEQKQSNRVRELQLLESVFQQVIDTEQLFYEKYRGRTAEEIKEWDHLFFNRLEWLAFLINQKFMTDKELVDYFKVAVIYWYERIFVEHYSKDVQKDDKQFPQLKLLYKFYEEQDKVIQAHQS